MWRVPFHRGENQGARRDRSPVANTRRTDDGSPRIVKVVHFNDRQRLQPIANANSVDGLALTSGFGCSDNAICGWMRRRRLVHIVQLMDSTTQSMALYPIKQDISASLKGLNGMGFLFRHGIVVMRISI